MSELNDALIQEHAKTLKLPALRREYGHLARQARADSWSYEGYLRELRRYPRVLHNHVIGTRSYPHVHRHLRPLPPPDPLPIYRHLRYSSSSLPGWVNS